MEFSSPSISKLSNGKIGSFDVGHPELPILLPLDRPSIVNDNKPPGKNLIDLLPAPYFPEFLPDTVTSMIAGH